MTPKSQTATDAPPLADVPTATDAEIEADVRNIPSRRATGTWHCQTCDRGTMHAAQDLDELVAAPGGRILVTGLTGGRCDTCSAIDLDDPSIRSIERARERFAAIGDYETTVTRIGKMAGTYLKGDLRRVLDIQPGDKLVWTPTTHDQAVVEIQRHRE